MRRRLLIPLLLAISALLAVTAAQGEIFQKGNLRIKVSGGLVPQALPRERLAPVKAQVKGEITTTDGTHPPALRLVRIELNRHGRLSTQGLPSCSSGQLQSTTTEQALLNCGDALVGRGHFRADISFPTVDPLPAEGPIRAFNGVSGGHQALLLHLYAAAPARFTFVFVLKITHKKQGEFGTVLTAPIPTLAGGQGSVSEIDLRLGRNYTYRGQSRSYISASCPAPAGFSGGPFTFARGSFRFADQQTVSTSIASALHRALGPSSEPEPADPALVPAEVVGQLVAQRALDLPRQQRPVVAEVPLERVAVDDDPVLEALAGDPVAEVLAVGVALAAEVGDDHRHALQAPAGTRPAGRRSRRRRALRSSSVSGDFGHRRQR